MHFYGRARCRKSYKNIDILADIYIIYTIMKKIISILLICAAGAVCCFADDQIVNDPNVLPEPARAFVAANFPNAKISFVKIDRKGTFIEDYTAILADGANIEFTPAGEMKEIKNYAGVPAAVVPAKISEYVAKNYAGAKIIKLKKKIGGFEVKLTNSLELVFSQNGDFLGVDD